MVRVVCPNVFMFLFHVVVRKKKKKLNDKKNPNLGFSSEIEKNQICFCFSKKDPKIEKYLTGWSKIKKKIGKPF